jgi:hypothetical protein
MRRGTRLVAVIVIALVVDANIGCKRSDSNTKPDASMASASAAPSASGAPCRAAIARASSSAAASAAPTSSAAPAIVGAGALPPPKDITGAIARLGDKRQSVRDAAALEIRAAIAANPAASRDKGEAFWKAKLDAIPAGTSRAEYVRRTGAQGGGSVGGGGGTTANFRLDDFWVCSAYFETNTMTLMSHGQLVRSPIHVGVDLGPTFTGNSSTYLIDGTKAEELDFVKGEVTHRRVFYANGQLHWEQGYANGKSVGPYRAFYSDGRKENECAYVDGGEDGLCVSWWPNGQKRTESTSVAGKKNGRSISWREDGTRESEFEHRDGVELGQAAWDECDRPIYAHGSLGDGGP